MTAEISILNPENIISLEKYSPQGAAEAIIYQTGEDLIFNGTNFYEWNGKHWQLVPEIVLDQLAIKMLKTATKRNAADMVWSLATQLHKTINANPYAIHLINGVYDIERMGFFESEEYKNQYIIGHLPIEYRAGATCPMWQKFLQEVMQGNSEKIRIVQEFFGYCLLGDNRYQQALVLLGAGNNGKSVLLEVLQSLFHKVTHLDLRQIEDERYIYHLQDAWLNMASELAYKSVESTANIKAVIAGETVQAAPKWHKGFSFRPRAKIAFATNGLPRNNDTSLGYFRRLLIINMDYRVSQPNPHIIRELKSEASGIFNWMLEGLKNLVQRGSFHYENPYIELYKEESSSLYSWWVDEGKEFMRSPGEFKNARGHMLQFPEVVYNDENHVYFSAFYMHYEAYCLRGGMRASGRNKLRSECERLQIPIVFYTGNYNARVVCLDVNHFVNDFKVVNKNVSDLGNLEKDVF